MGQRRTRKSHAPQDMDFAEEIMPGPSSGSQNPVVPTTDSEELENTQVQGVSQAPLSPPDQPIDRNESHFKKLEHSLNIITERLSRLEEKDQTRASHSRSRSPHSRSRSRSRYSRSPFSHISRENSRVRSHYSPRESHSRSPVSSRHYREPLSSHQYSSRRSHPDSHHLSRNFWLLPEFL